ncbi:hypothetical protein NFY03_34445, partial [Pseudomonas aeruginosa]|uniref:hypothetical protein n=2 Tax=Pseudomonas aeruginosa TaxID=287 RepID=UPI002078832A
GRFATRTALSQPTKETTMQLSDIKQVIEVSGEIEAQKRLNDGWVLLAAAGGTNQDKEGYIIYSLGSTEEPKPIKAGAVFSPRMEPQK